MLFLREVHDHFVIYKCSGVINNSLHFCKTGLCQNISLLASPHPHLVGFDVRERKSGMAPWCLWRHNNKETNYRIWKFGFSFSGVESVKYFKNRMWFYIYVCSELMYSFMFNYRKYWTVPWTEVKYRGNSVLKIW